MANIIASIITIGEEILYGHTLDTNSQFIGEQLTAVGIKVGLKLSTGDQKDTILDALDHAEKRSDLILITGGLGPTSDDITKKCLADFFNVGMKMNEEALRQVELYFRRRGFTLTETNRNQAMIPENARLIINDVGTAAGMWFDKKNKTFISMPGVPHEMQQMMIEKIIPEIKKKYHAPAIFHKHIMTAGIGESWLAEKILEWENNLPPNMSLAYLPGYGQVKLRITGQGTDQEKLKRALDQQSAELRKYINEYIYGEDGISLQERIGQLLTEQHQTLSLAESCTGGYLAHLITTVPGSSNYFISGLVAYHNQVKMDLLGVKKQTLERVGAVSEETVKEMASGVRNRFYTDFGVATSGISGPGGGTPEKPVGTVWIAVADGHSCVAQRYSIPKNRINNIKYASVAALAMLWQRIVQKNGTD